MCGRDKEKERKSVCERDSVCCSEWVRSSCTYALLNLCTCCVDARRENERKQERETGRERQGADKEFVCAEVCLC